MERSASANDCLPPPKLDKSPGKRYHAPEEATAVILTITTSTTTAAATPEAMAAFGMVAVISLIAFLTIQELASASEGPRSRLLSRALNVGVIPLLMVFAAIVFTTVLEILR